MLLVPVAILTACVRNEFTVTFTFAKDTSFTPTATIVYYSSDKKKGWITEQTATGMEQGNRITGMTRLPAVVYVYSETGTAPKAILWAERGDNLKVDATEKSGNGLWSATGNETTEALNAWRTANGNIIQARASKEINASVAGYVRSHPDMLASAIMLLTEYDGHIDPEGLSRLWRSLTIGNDDREAVLAALGRTSDQLAEMPAYKLKTLSLRSRGDSLYTFWAGQGNSGAILLLWTSSKDRRQAVRDLRAELADTSKSSDTRMLVLDINMSADTMGWADMAINDSLPAHLQQRWIRLWAPGAEQNSSLRPLRLHAAPVTLLEVSTDGKVTQRH